MAVTPEGKIKKMVKEVLAEFSERKAIILDPSPNHYNSSNHYNVLELKQFWPVPSGFGASDVDCIVCYYGVYIAIETKAPGKKPTPRQELTLAETIGAGGIAIVISSEEGCEILRNRLLLIKMSHANNS